MSPQLPLEAYILSQGGFDGVARDDVAELTYIQLKGGEDPGSVRPIASGVDDVTAIMDSAVDGLSRLIADFDQQNMPYLSQPRVQFLARGSTYDHLARVQEWSAGDGEDA